MSIIVYLYYSVLYTIMSNLPNSTFWESSLGSNFWANITNDIPSSKTHPENDIVRTNPKNHRIQQEYSTNKTIIKQHNQKKSNPSVVRIGNFNNSTRSTNTHMSNKTILKQHNQKKSNPSTNNYIQRKEYHNEHKKQTNTPLKYPINDSIDKTSKSDVSSITNPKFGTPVTFESTFIPDTTKLFTSLVCDKPVVNMSSYGYNVVTSSYRDNQSKYNHPRSVHPSKYDQPRNSHHSNHDKSKNTLTNKKNKKIDYDIVVKMSDNRFIHAITNNETCIIMVQNGYINATQLCNIFRYNYFEHLQHTDEFNTLVDEVSSIMALDRNELIINVIDEKHKKNNGIYVHEELVIDLALMLSSRIKNIIRNVMNDKQIVDILKRSSTPVRNLKKKILVKNTNITTSIDHHLESLDGSSAVELPSNIVVVETSKELLEKININQQLVENISLKLLEHKKIINNALILIKNSETSMVQLDIELENVMHRIKTLKSKLSS